MTTILKELSILDRFRWEVPPLGIKFFSRKPEGMEKLEGKRALCEMLKKAQEGKVFFAETPDHTCEAGLYVLGQAEAPGPYISGEFGAGLKIFQEPRSAARLYHYIPRIKPGVVNALAFAPMNALPFDPDILIIQAQTFQTEILLRAMSYRSGRMWASKCSAAIGCAWLMVYPYLSGELNYMVTGLGHGMKRRELFPEGRQLVSIPFDLLPEMLENLQEMPWELPAYQAKGTEFVQKLLDHLGLAGGEKKSG
ncbi:MAG: DUF169 domain-containing protein [Thermodesulfobacteriota bacterium]